MANATSTQLQELYVAYFGRAADPTGLDYWTEKGITQAAFAANMYAQAEFKDAYGSKTVEAQVNQIYKNLFDRDADVTGLTYWTQEINLGNLKVAEIATHLIWAAQNNSGSSDDKTALTNRTDAAVAYTAEVKTSTANILAYQPTTSDPWVAGDNITEAKTYLEGIDKDTAHSAAGITASIAKFTAADAVAGSTYAFSKDKIETLTGGEGDDTFKGDNNTVTKADSVVGGLGTDTLKLTATMTLPDMDSIETLEFHDFTIAALDLSASEYSDITTLRYDTSTVVNSTTTLGAGVSVILDEITGIAGDLDIAGDKWTTGTFTVIDSGSSTHAVDIDFNSTKTTSYTIKEDGASRSYIHLNNTGAKAKTVYVDADYKLTIEDVAIATTIDASASSGTTSITGAVAKTVYTGGTGEDTFNWNVADGANTISTIKMGAGNDVLDVVNLNAAGDVKNSSNTWDGGDGTDSLRGDDALIAGLADLNTTNYAKKGISNFEKVWIDTALADGDTFEMTNFGVNHVKLTTDTSDDATISGITTGATIELGVALDALGGGATHADKLTLTLSDKAGSGDTVNIDINNTTGTSAYGFTAAEVETISINAEDSDQANVVALNAANATKLILDTGTGNLTVNLAQSNSASTVMATVDATAATGAGGIVFTADDSALSGITYKGGSGGDDVLLGDLSDDATMGSGNDTIDLHDGTNTVDISSGGNDEIEFNSGTGKVTVTGFATDDVIDIQGLGDAGEQQYTAVLSSAADVTTDYTVISTLDASSTSVISGGTEKIADFTDLTDVAAYLEEGFAEASGEDFWYILNDGTNSYGYVFDESGSNTTIAAGELVLALVVNNYIIGADDVAQT